MFYSVIDHHTRTITSKSIICSFFINSGWSTDSTFTQVLNVLQLAVLQTFMMLYLKEFSMTLFRKNSGNIQKTAHGLMAKYQADPQILQSKIILTEIYWSRINSWNVPIITTTFPQLLLKRLYIYSFYFPPWKSYELYNRSK